MLFFLFTNHLNIFWTSRLWCWDFILFFCYILVLCRIVIAWTWHGTCFVSVHITKYFPLILIINHIYNISTNRAATMTPKNFRPHFPQLWVVSIFLTIETGEKWLQDENRCWAKTTLKHVLFFQNASWWFPRLLGTHSVGW